MMEYPFMEPQNGQFEVEEVYLVKRGITELTYGVLVQILPTAGNGATFQDDYETNINRQSGSSIVFPHDEKRLKLFTPGNLQLSLLADNLAEGSKRILLFSAPESTLPYRQPEVGDPVFAEATIFILDEYSMLLLEKYYYLKMISLPTDITIGWNETSYTVPEDSGSLEVCFHVIFPPPNINIPTILMRVNTEPGTAGWYSSIDICFNELDDYR